MDARLSVMTDAQLDAELRSWDCAIVDALSKKRAIEDAVTKAQVGRSAALGELARRRQAGLTQAQS